MKITFFLPSLAGGGAEKMIVNLIQGLRSYPCELEVVVASGKDGVWLSFLSEDIHYVDLQVGRVMKAIPALIRHLKKSKPDILFSGIDHANIAAIIAGKLSGLKVKNIISIHRLSTEIRNTHQNKREKIVNRLKPFLYSKANCVVCVSDGIYREILDEFHLPVNKLQRIYNPILFEKSIDSGKLLSKKQNDSEKKTIVAAGRLEEVKDYSMLISTMDIIRKTVNCQLIIYGEGGQRELLEEKISALGLENNISLPGFVMDLQMKLKQADLFVLSSITEGFGNVIVEALAAGVPVVSTDCPCGPREILENGKFGVLVSVGDETAMAEAIIQVLQQKVNREELIARAREFSIEKISKEYYDLFSKLLEEG